MTEPTPYFVADESMRLPRAYTVDDVAREYRIDRSTVCVAIQQGKLKAGRVGRRYMVLASSVVEWMSREKP